MADSIALSSERARYLTRRWFLRDCGVGLGGIALNSLLAGESPAASASDPLAPKLPHFSPKVKRVVYLFHAGAPSHLELYDHKPELSKRDGQLPPAELVKGYRAAFINPNSALLGPKYAFRRYGDSGIELSQLLPHVGSQVDNLCFIRTMHTEAVNHAPAQIMMNTGSQQFGRPSFGAWTMYGLGTMSADLPGYVVLTSGIGTSGGASNYGSGFLPTSYGGIPFRGTGDPVLYLSNPPGFDGETQRESLDTLRQLNEIALSEVGDPRITSRIQSYETAYRLQTSAPELMDLASESQEVLDLYGIQDTKEANYARNCLLARRLLERGVRFVQLFHEAWDQHGDLKKALSNLLCGALVTGRLLYTLGERAEFGGHNIGCQRFLPIGAKRVGKELRLESAQYDVAVGNRERASAPIGRWPRLSAGRLRPNAVAGAIKTTDRTPPGGNSGDG